MGPLVRTIHSIAAEPGTRQYFSSKASRRTMLQRDSDTYIKSEIGRLGAIAKSSCVQEK